MVTIIKLLFVLINTAWIQLSKGITQVTATFKTESGFTHAGATLAKANCWSMLKGGLTVGASGPAKLYFR